MSEAIEETSVMAPATTSALRSNWSRLHPLFVGIAMSLGAWLVSRVVVGFRWPAARSPFAFNPDLWNRWDSKNYLSISLHGRTFAKCFTHGLGDYLSVKGAWCGTAQWLPGYPAVLTLFHHLGLSVTAAGVLVSQLSMLAVFLLVWFGWGSTQGYLRGGLLLLLVGVFPGAVYGYAIFPVGLALALTIGALLAGKHRHFATMGLLLLLANLTYPSDWFATVGVVIALAIIGSRTNLFNGLRLAAWGAVGFLAIPLLWLNDAYYFHQPRAFTILVGQAHMLKSTFGGLLPKFLPDRMGSSAHWVEAQLVVTVIAVTIAVLVAAKEALPTREFAANYDLVPALLGATVVVVFLVGKGQSNWYRGVYLVAPAAIALRRAPVLVLAGLVVAMGLITLQVSHYFFTWQLI